MGAGVVEGRMPGLVSGGSGDVDRSGRMICASDWDAGGAAAAAAAVGLVDCCSVALCWDSERASKLKGLRCSVVGGNGETGEISTSLLASSSFDLGDGVISGVIVFKMTVGLGGAGLLAWFNRLANMFVLSKGQFISSHLRQSSSTVLAQARERGSGYIPSKY